MGLCAPCLNQISESNEVLEGSRPPQQKLRPLLADLEADFKEFCGNDGVLDARELGEIWKKCAARKVGKLTAEDTSLIEKSSRDYFDQLDVTRDGKVSYEEFITYMLGASEGRGALSDLRSDLLESINEDPTQLKKLIKNFKKWDKNGDGFVTPAELDEHLAELETMMETAHPNKKQKFTNKADQVRELKVQIFDEADVDHDGQVDLWEVMAHTLGRRKIPVEILLYDISKGYAAKLGKLLVGKNVAALHSGLLIYGSEYWYGGQIFRSQPPCSKAFGQPLKAPWDTPLPLSEQCPTLPVIRVGYTFVTHAEFTTWLKREVTHRYRDLSQYDLFTHSCHHFVNEAIEFLTGGKIPDKILELQRLAMTPTMMAMRPALNRVLGGFGEAGKSVDEKYFTVDQEPDTTKSTSAAEVAGMQEFVDSGEVVLVEGLKDSLVVATILSQVDGKCEIKFFDPVTGDIKRQSGINPAQIKQRL